MSKILLLDNYDSFTFNLAHLLESLGAEFEVRRNDKITLDEAASYSRILLSPGPGIPAEAGMMPQIVRACAGRVPILGVCLGHQCIGEVFGATLVNMAVPVHGKVSHITVLEPADSLFRGLPKSFTVGRYHSWLVNREALPLCFTVTAVAEGGEIMALAHKEFDLRGVQFHPESVMTELGSAMIKNWLSGS